MLLGEVMQRSEADAETAGRENQANAQPGQNLDAAVTIWMVCVGGSCGQRHAGHDQDRGEHIAQKFEAGGDNGSRPSCVADPNVRQRQRATRPYADRSDATTAPKVGSGVFGQKCLPCADIATSSVSMHRPNAVRRATSVCIISSVEHRAMPGGQPAFVA